jgi:hypothetical protein
MDNLGNIIKGMEPQAAMAALGRAVKQLFTVLDEETRGRFLVELVGDPQNDKVSGLVHL